ncbi:MAG TPA: cytochrome c-type biogenesis CcmF C-terminal domain-containing protein [Polyangia bacterium]|nr:cytochrome c-type biogenesis CcmF C-terminal domain-containing protein [Polyangia bacterium]
MAAFGTLTLLIALVVATYSGVASIIGARRRSARLMESGRAAAYTLTGVLGLSSVAMWYAFVSGDYSIKYVQRYSDASSPLFYKITAYWGGLDGSILWWAFLLSVFASIAIHTNRHRQKEILPYTIATLMVIVDFFLFVIVFFKNPFDTFLTGTPSAGQGLNPLLQNAYMVTHPPSLYTGLVGMAIPYAFAMGALISGHLDDAWIAAVRRWTLISWFFLSMGLTLGMLWAYEELGWGGFWGWDPVENAGLLPWLTGTAFLHSVMIQERRGMLKIWNFTLVILTFLLTIIGTTMTRTGIVPSVHAFGSDNVLLVLFGIFLLLIVLVSFGFMIGRLPELRARGKLESLLSREAAFILNNWILLFAAVVILFGNMWPTLSEKFLGQRVNVGLPYYNKLMVPVGLILLFLTGVGPLIAWRKATTSHLKYQFTLPLSAGALTFIACVATGLRESWAAVICFSLCAFTATTITQEFIRGAMVRKKNTGSDILTSLLGMVVRGRRRYGGYVVHLGIVLMFLGFAGQAYQRDREVSASAGKQESFGRYVLRFDRLAHEEDRQKEMITGEISVLIDGKVVDHMRPARWYFHKHEKEPTTEVAIRRSPAEDLYITLGNYDLANGTAAMKIVINPMVDWIWFGFMLLALGTGVALLPESVLAPITVRLPAGATARDGAGASATMLVLIVAAAIGVSAPAHAAVDPAFVAREQKWIETNVFCPCNCRHLLGSCGGECAPGPEYRKKVHDMLEAGKTRDEIIAFLGGSAALASPPKTGVQKLAWALPYTLGVAGAGALAFGAWRFSRRTPPPAAKPDPAKPDHDLEDRLEDELSRLDQ